MRLTKKQMEEVARIKNDPFIEFDKSLSDEEILEQARFIETGYGIDIYNSEEEYRIATNTKK